MDLQLDDIIHTLRSTIRELKDLRDKAAPASQVEHPLDLWFDLAFTKLTSFSNILCSAQLALASGADPAAVRQVLLQHLRDGVQVEASLMHSLMRAANPGSRGSAGAGARGTTSSCADDGSRTPTTGSTSADGHS